MATFTPGDQISLAETFEQSGAPVDPATVVFNLRRPDGSQTVYTYSVSAQLVRVGVGQYVLNLDAGLAFGEYRYNAVGTDPGIEIAGTFTVIPSIVSEPPPPSAPPGPQFGPCQQWITGADVTCPGVASPSILDAMAFEAAQALFEISGRQFTGLCERVVRPCRDACGCWGSQSVGAGPWSWSTWPAWGAGAWSWRNECGDRLGCAPTSKVRLAGYPVREIAEVLIDGAVLPAADGGGNPNYRLDEWSELVRMDDPGPPVQTRRWPACQNMSLAADQPGTFQVTYRCGVDPPPLAREAAAQLACQLYLGVIGSSECQLPQGTTKVTRQGVQVERGLLANWFDPKKPTGLVAVDLFLAAYWRTRAARRPALFSPDLQQFARRAGT